MTLPMPTRVLVVDDDHDAAWALTSLLRMGLASDVRAAFGGAEAVDQVCAFRPQAIIMDIAMPQVDGIEVARVLRRLFDVDAQPLLIALTGLHAADDSHRIASGGFDDCLFKPVDLPELLLALRRRPAGR